VLREINEKGKRKSPDDAPTDFVESRWERHVFSEDGIDKPRTTCFPASGGRTSGTTVGLR